MTDDDILLTRNEAADFPDLSIPTLERWAMAGEGPPIKRLGNRCRYSLGGLKAWRDRPRSTA